MLPMTDPRFQDDQGPLSVDQIKEIAGDGYLYLGSPYSKYPAGITVAFRDVARLTGKLIKLGVNVYSPIAHTHSVAIYSGMDPMDHGIWLKADRCMMDAARGLLVAEMEGWAESYGLAHEIDVFRAAGKSIVHLLP